MILALALALVVLGHRRPAPIPAGERPIIYRISRQPDGTYRKEKL